jgi:hypothetical protein
VGRDSSVGVAARYGLVDGAGIDSGFSAPFQTGLGAHPVTYTVGTGSLSRRYSGRSVALTTHPI